MCNGIPCGCCGLWRICSRKQKRGCCILSADLIVKLTAAFTALAIGFVLELTGYVPNTVQSLATQNSIRVLMCVVPTIGVILAYVVFKSKYKLDDKFMKKVVAKTERLRREIRAVPCFNCENNKQGIFVFYVY